MSATTPAQAATSPARSHTEPITGEELARMPDLGRCELVEGRINSMSPTNWKHGRYVGRIFASLNAFVTAQDLGEVLTGEVGIYTGRDPDTVRGADVLFISHARLDQVTPESFLDAAPELVIEVISPSNTWQEMREKIDEYFAIGVDRVWIVEPKQRQVLVYRAPTEFDAVTEEEELEGEGGLEDFSLPLSELFD